MAEASEISWTDNTFNPWEGCTKVSPACANCYAEERANRYQSVKWGPESAGGTRRVTSEGNWDKPAKWNKLALRGGCIACGGRGCDIHNNRCGSCKGKGTLDRRPRVFCASLADVFEAWEGRMITTGGLPFWWCGGSMSNSPVIEDSFTKWVTMQDIRERLFDLIQDTPALDWLLLTKRPENVLKMMPLPGIETSATGYPPNVWIGTTVENQEQADKRIPELLKIPAAVRFLSCEPLLGPISLQPYRDHTGTVKISQGIDCDWVIVGGESGSKARPMHPKWARSIVQQCEAAGVPVHFKQWGEWCPSDHATTDLLPWVPSTVIPGLLVPPKIPFKVMMKEGADRLFTPDGLFSGDCPKDGDEWMLRVGKLNAGRQLDGRILDGFPRVALPMVKGGAS